MCKNTLWIVAAAWLLLTLVPAGAQQDGAITLSATVPKEVLSGDPIPIRMTLRNTTDRQIETDRLYVFLDILGVRWRLTKDGAEDVPLFYYKRSGWRSKDKLPGKAEWRVENQLRRMFVFPEKDVGKYELTATHQASGASWKGTFEVRAPAKPLTVVAEFKTPTVVSRLRLPDSRRRSPDWRRRKKDVHKVFVREEGKKVELLYWNDIPRFDGYVPVQELSGKTLIEGVLLRARLEKEICFDENGNVRPFAEDLLPAHLKRGPRMDSPFRDQLQYHLLVNWRPNEVVAVCLTWVDGEKLWFFSIGKYLPITGLDGDLPLPTPHYGTADRTKAFGDYDICDRFYGYKVLCPAKAIDLPEVPESVAEVKQEGTTVLVTCKAAGSGRRMRVEVDYEGNRQKPER